MLLLPLQTHGLKIAVPLSRTEQSPDELTHGSVELFQLHAKDTAGQNEGLISVSCNGKPKWNRTLQPARQQSDVRQARSTCVTWGEMVQTQLLQGSGSNPVTVGG